ncbi:MAG: hypothetical protein ACRDSJ_15995 [Rubrobacteraceae bacterium]
MHNPLDCVLARIRRRELLDEAEQNRLARKSRRSKNAPVEGKEHIREPCPEVRPGDVEDAARIADFLEVNGAPRWVAFEEHFILAEEDGEVLGVLRFREDSGQLYLGLLVTAAWAEERPLAVGLYAGARVMARGLGLREVRARARGRETHPRAAGFRRRGGKWWADVAV